MRDSATAEAMGVTANVVIKPYEDDPENFVVIECYIYPPGPGLDSLAYSRVMRVPENEA